MDLGLALPSAGEIEAAPHLVMVALAQAAILATRCALESAHPILARTGTLPELTDAEHFGALILHVSDQLAELLDDYAAACLHRDVSTADTSAAR